MEEAVTVWKGWRVLHSVQSGTKGSSGWCVLLILHAQEPCLLVMMLPLEIAQLTAPVHEEQTTRVCVEMKCLNECSASQSFTEGGSTYKEIHYCCVCFTGISNFEF